MIAPLACITIATDFTAGAMAAARRALALPLAERARVELVHVLPARAARGPAYLAVRAAANTRLEAAVAALRRLAPKAAVTGRLCYGAIAEELVSAAKAAGAEVIAIGRHGERVVRDLFIGSTARRVARSSALPVLVVRSEPARPYTRPVFAIDPAADARALVAAGVRFVGDRTVTALLVHASHVPFERLLSRALTKQGLTAERRRVHHEALAALRALTATDATQNRFKPSVRRGDPRTVLARVMAHRRADLVVVGTHRRSAVARMHAGSVVEHVIETAPCDVLVVPVRVRA